MAALTLAASILTAILSAVVGPVLVVLVQRDRRQTAEVHILVNSQMTEALATIERLEGEIVALRGLVADQAVSSVPPIQPGTAFQGHADASGV